MEKLGVTCVFVLLQTFFFFLKDTILFTILLAVNDQAPFYITDLLHWHFALRSLRSDDKSLL